MKALRLTITKIKEIEAVLNANEVFYFSSNGIVKNERGSLDTLDTGNRTKRVENGHDLIQVIRSVGKAKFRLIYNEDIIARFQSRLKNRRDITRRTQ